MYLSLIIIPSITVRVFSIAGVHLVVLLTIYLVLTCMSVAVCIVSVFIFMLGVSLSLFSL